MIITELCKAFIVMHVIESVGLLVQEPHETEQRAKCGSQNADWPHQCYILYSMSAQNENEPVFSGIAS